jgi:hypothetical protein
MMQKFVGPGGEVLDAYGDRLARPVVAEPAGAFCGERADLKAPGAGDLDQRQGREEGGLLLDARQGIAFGLGVPEDGDTDEAGHDKLGLVLGLVVLGLGLPKRGGENVEGAFALADMSSDLLPLAEAACVVVAEESGEELIAPAPAGTGPGVVWCVAEEDLGAGGGDGASLKGFENLLGDTADVLGLRHGGSPVRGSGPAGRRPAGVGGGEGGSGHCFFLPPGLPLGPFQRTQFKKRGAVPCPGWAAGAPVGLGLDRGLRRPAYPLDQGAEELLSCRLAGRLGEAGGLAEVGGGGVRPRDRNRSRPVDRRSTAGAPYRYPAPRRFTLSRSAGGSLSCDRRPRTNVASESATPASSCSSSGNVMPPRAWGSARRDRETEGR